MTIWPVLKTAKGNGVELRYADWGGEGKTVLCIHGLTANCRCWDGIGRPLSAALRVVAVDLRGRGGSGKPATGYSLLHHVADIRCLMDELGIEDAVLMGHSLGAFIALAFAARFPERTDRLILMDGGGRLEEAQMDKVMEGIRPALLRLGTVFPSTSDYLHFVREAPTLHPWNPDIENCYRYEIEPVEDGVRCNIDPTHILEESTRLRDVDVRFFYPHVACNTLILRATRGLMGDDDILLPQAALATMLQAIPTAVSRDIKGVNHYGIVFQPHEARDQELRQFCADV